MSGTDKRGMSHLSVSLILITRYVQYVWHIMSDPLFLRTYYAKPIVSVWPILYAVRG